MAPLGFRYSIAPSAADASQLATPAHAARFDHLGREAEQRQDVLSVETVDYYLVGDEVFGGVRNEPFGPADRFQQPESVRPLREFASIRAAALWGRRNNPH